MVIGIPRAFLYYQYRHLWESFFETLGVETLLSPDTNKEILSRGMNFAYDESCLSSKIYLGHVAWLIGRCDMILVPRISNFGKNGTVCTKFQAIYDLVRNTFREYPIKILHYNIDLKNLADELSSFVKMGKLLGKSKPLSLFAYWNAKQAEKAAEMIALNDQELSLKTDKIKILLIAHRYNLFDKSIGEPVIRTLKEMDAIPVIADIVNKKEAIARSAELSDTLPWALSKELLGSIPIYREKVDGIILLSAFPCGPDSMVNEIIIRRVKDKPILNILLDSQQGTAGLETRLESFIDIIKFKRDKNG